jgi:hypothetical protein
MRIGNIECRHNVSYSSYAYYTYERTSDFIASAISYHVYCTTRVGGKPVLGGKKKRIHRRKRYLFRFSQRELQYVCTRDSSSEHSIFYDRVRQVQVLIFQSITSHKNKKTQSRNDSRRPRPDCLAQHESPRKENTALKKHYQHTPTDQENEAVGRASANSHCWS